MKNKVLKVKHEEMVMRNIIHKLKRDKKGGDSK